MSIATLNRITREQTVFYNTKKEREIAEGNIPILRKPKTYRHWTGKERALLKGDLSNTAIAYMVGRTPSAVKWQRSQLRYRKSP